MAGVPVLLDLHEAMPEFFRSRFPRAANPWSYRLLRLQEKLSIAFADEVMTVNEPLAERLRELGVEPERLTVVLNSPDLGLFDSSAQPQREFMADGSLRIVYAGALTPTYELDVVLRAIAAIVRATTCAQHPGHVLRTRRRPASTRGTRGRTRDRRRSSASPAGSPSKTFLRRSPRATSAWRQPGSIPSPA